MFFIISILPFLILILVIFIVALIASKSSNLGKSKRDSADANMRKHAKQFADTINDDNRESVVGTWKLVWNNDEPIDETMWFISPMASQLLRMDNNIMVMRFHEDGTSQIGVLNTKTNMFYGSQENPLLEEEYKKSMFSKSKTDVKDYLMPPYQVYEVIDNNFVQMYEDDANTNNWVAFDYPYILDEGFLRVPVNNSQTKPLYASFVRIIMQDMQNTY